MLCVISDEKSITYLNEDNHKKYQLLESLGLRTVERIEYWKLQDVFTIWRDQVNYSLPDKEFLYQLEFLPDVVKKVFPHIDYFWAMQLREVSEIAFKNRSQLDTSFLHREVSKVKSKVVLTDILILEIQRIIK